MWKVFGAIISNKNIMFLFFTYIHTNKMFEDPILPLFTFIVGQQDYSWNKVLVIQDKAARIYS